MRIQTQIRKYIRKRISIALSLAALLASACGSVSAPSNNFIQDFTNQTLLVGGGNVHEFDTKTGEYSAKLIALSPNANAVLAIYLGQVSGGLCTPIVGQMVVVSLNSGGLPPSGFGSITKGHYCVQVYDPVLDPASRFGLGLAAQGVGAQTYTLRVTYPN